MPYFQDISILTELPNSEIANILKEKIDLGIYKTGKLIVLHAFDKIQTSNGKLIKGSTGQGDMIRLCSK